MYLCIRNRTESKKRVFATLTRVAVRALRAAFFVSGGIFAKISKLFLAIIPSDTLNLLLD